MGHVTRLPMATSILGLSLTAWNSARADSDGDGNHQPFFVQSNLISNLPGVAPLTKPNLLNSWGLALPPTGDFWINANNAGVALLVDGTGVANPNLPAVTIPLPAPPLRADTNPAASAPAGIIWNGTGSFDLPGTKSSWITQRGEFLHLAELRHVAPP